MNSKLPNPHQRALVTLGGIVALAMLVCALMLGLSLAGIANPALVWIGVVVVAVFGLMWLSIWLLGWLQVRRSAAFLASERPLLRWTYSSAEWQQFKEVIWQEEKDDWKVQWGCLAFLLALAGLLTGVMIGLDEGGLEAVINGLIGGLLGGLVGALIGALVAGGNYWGAWQARHQTQPGQVALGVGEIYANGAYFRADGVKYFVQSADLQRDNPSTLQFQLIFPPRPRMPLDEQWLLPVPARVVDDVEEILSQVVSSQQPE